MKNVVLGNKCLTTLPMFFLPSQTPWNYAFLLNIWSHDQLFFFFTISQQQGVAQLTLWLNLPQSPLP